MKAKEYESPFAICPELKETDLDKLSQKMLEVVEQTVSDHQSAYDDSYTLETTLFGRIRRLFLALHKDKTVNIYVSSPTMDYVPSICNIPVRVFRDDPNSPKKKKLFFRNDCEQQQMSLLLDESESRKASLLTWRLFIQAPVPIDESDIEFEGLEDDYRIVLVGYNTVTGSMMAKWESQTIKKKPSLYVVSDELPLAKIVNKHDVKPKDTNKDKQNIIEKDE